MNKNKFIVLLACLCLSLPQLAQAQLAAVNKVATAIVSQELKHSDTINVRRVLTDLNPNDFITELQIIGSALQPGSYFQLIKDQSVIYQSSLGQDASLVQIPLNLTNGVDYKKLTLRSIGSVRIVQIMAIINNSGSPAVIVNPPPVVVTPIPVDRPTPPIHNPRPPVLTNPAIVTCTTFSNGLNFSEMGRNVSLTRSNLYSQCNSHQSTLSAECNANIQCDNEPVRPVITCNTFSRGINFERSGLNSSVIRSQLYSQCNSHQSTLSNDCNLNIRCSDEPVQRSVITCKTFSNGLEFTYYGINESNTRSVLYSQCNANQSTTSAQCNLNISCDNNPVHTLYSCSTFSRGLNFSEVGRSLSQTRSDLYSKCNANQATTSAECNANIACVDISGRDPGMHRPPHLTPGNAHQHPGHQDHQRPPRYEEPAVGENRDQNGNLIPGRR